MGQSPTSRRYEKIANTVPYREKKKDLGASKAIQLVSHEEKVALLKAAEEHALKNPKPVFR